jgi:hypothetical protein
MQRHGKIKILEKTRKTTVIFRIGDQRLFLIAKMAQERKEYFMSAACFLWRARDFAGKKEFYK